MSLSFSFGSGNKMRLFSLSGGNYLRVSEEKVLLLLLLFIYILVEVNMKESYDKVTHRVIVLLFNLSQVIRVNDSFSFYYSH